MQLPLSEKLRPSTLMDVVGQEQLTCAGSWLHQAMKNQKPRSILLYGPPGCGKTTIARLYARQFQTRKIFLSAVNSGIAEIKKILQEKEQTPLLGLQTILFIDEIHRFNRAQQDLFLPYMEDGSLVLIGATTENPSFALNNALLSRLRVLALKPLDEKSLLQLITRYEEQVSPLNLDQECKNYLAQISFGDGRHLLNLLENIEDLNLQNLDLSTLTSHLQKRSPLYDKNQEGHYDLISALHKSVRASDPDAALYWLARMLGGGEDPLFLTRRLIRMALEDIGLADPEALSLALSAEQAYQRLGSPEGDLALAEITIYLALAPKSNSVYTAFKTVQQLASNTHNAMPKKWSLNAPTQLMKDQGYGKNYQYDHDDPKGCSGQDHFPEGLPRTSIYHPKERGFEREMQKRLLYFDKLRKTTSSEK